MEFYYLQDDFQRLKAILVSQGPHRREGYKSLYIPAEIVEIDIDILSRGKIAIKEKIAKYKDIILIGYIPSILIIAVSLIMYLYYATIKVSFPYYSVNEMVVNWIAILLLPPVLSVTYHRAKNKYRSLVPILVGFLFTVCSLLALMLADGRITYLMENPLLSVTSLIFESWIVAFIIYGAWTVIFEVSARSLLYKH